MKITGNNTYDFLVFILKILIFTTKNYIRKDI